MAYLKKPLTKEQAYQKIKSYCSYQERSHFEVRGKLYAMGLWKKDVDELLARLIEENYLNEERFAIHFAGGKFRMKQWGRRKIQSELKQKQVSEYCIRKALSELDAEAYRQTFERLVQRKWNALKGEQNIFIKKRKLKDFLLQKGYETDMVNATVRDRK